jgi:hypothetical protein
VADPTATTPQPGATLPQDAAESAQPEPRPAVENRWWVDSGTGKGKPPAYASPAEAEGAGGRPVRLAGERLFRAGRDFDQDRARSRLTDSNLNWIKEANPPEDGWAYVAATEGRSRADLIARVKQTVRLPRGVRAVLIDSGSSIRVVATGKPVGERLVELTIGADSAFDAWLEGDWVCERAYRGRDRALRDASRLFARYLVARD